MVDITNALADIFGDVLCNYHINYRHQYQDLYDISSFSSQRAYINTLYEVKLVVREPYSEERGLAINPLDLNIFSFGKIRPQAINVTNQSDFKVTVCEYLIYDIDDFCTELKKTALQHRDKQFYKAFDEVLNDRDKK